MSINSELLALVKAGNTSGFDTRVEQAKAEGLNFGTAILSLMKSHEHAYLERLFGLGVSADVAIEKRYLLSCVTTTPLWHARSCEKCEEVVSQALHMKSRPASYKKIKKKKKALHIESLRLKQKPSLKKSADGPDFEDLPMVIQTKSMKEYLKDPSNFEF